MNSKMTIGKKQMFAFGAMLAVVLALAWSSLSSIGTLGDIISIANNQTAKKTELAGKFATSAYQMRTGQRGVVMYTLLKNPAMVEKSRDLFQSGAATMRDTIGSIRPLLTKVESRGQVDRIESALSAWQSLYQELVSDCAADKCDGSLSALLDRLAGAGDQIQADAAKLIATQNDIRAEEGNSAASSVSTSRWITVCLILLALVAGGAALAVVWTSTATLRRIAGELSEGAEQTAGAASQVSSSSQSLAQGASEQAASLEETSASTEEINSMAHKNSDNSHAAADSVTSTQQNFMDANRALEQTVAAVGEISAQSGKISKIIKAIDEIAFQTNILALNAAVEAARAGEAGMGFAVVADEVRNLAQRCAQAAKDTSELIEESIAKSNDGKARVDEVASAIRAITGESGKVKTLVDEVHVSSQEQARGIEQIGKAIVQMEQVTQRSAANAEECASAAEELSSQSAAVREIVGRLNALVGGGEKSPAGGAHSSGPHMPVRRAGPTARHTQRPAGLAALAAAISHKTSGPVDPFPNPHTAEDVFPLESEMKRF